MQCKYSNTNNILMVCVYYFINDLNLEDFLSFIQFSLNCMVFGVFWGFVGCLNRTMFGYNEIAHAILLTFECGHFRFAQRPSVSKVLEVDAFCIASQAHFQWIINRCDCLSRWGERSLLCVPSFPVITIASDDKLGVCLRYIWHIQAAEIRTHKTDTIFFLYVEMQCNRISGKA